MSVGLYPISSAPISTLALDFALISGVGDLEFDLVGNQTNYLAQILNEQRTKRMVLAVEWAVQAGLPETQEWIDTVVANGGTVSASRERIINTLIAGLKSDGIWQKTDRLWFMSGENTAGALTDLRILSSATLVGSPFPPFAVDRGFTGVNGSPVSQYINSNYVPSAGPNWKLNSAHFSVWVLTNIVSAPPGGEILGVFSGTNADSGLDIPWNDGLVYNSINEFGGTVTGFAASTVIGHWIGNRSGPNAKQFYYNGALFATQTDPSIAVANNPMYILATNDVLSGSQGSFGNPNQVAAVSMGGSLTATEAANFYARMRTAMVAIGAST